MPKMANLTSFSKTEVGSQTVLPDRLILIGQKSVENAKIETFWVIFKQCVDSSQSRKVEKVKAAAIYHVTMLCCFYTACAIHAHCTQELLL